MPRCLCSQLQSPRKPMTAMWTWAGVLLVLSRGHRACSTRKSPCSCVTGKQKEQTSKTPRLTTETSSQHTCYAVRSHHPRGRKKKNHYYFPLLDQTYRFEQIIFTMAAGNSVEHHLSCLSPLQAVVKAWPLLTSCVRAAATSLPLARNPR